MLRTLSLVFGLLAAVALVIGFIPLLGWTNWLLTLPLGIAGLVLGVLSQHKPGQTLNIVVLALGAARLFLGGGIL